MNRVDVFGALYEEWQSRGLDRRSFLRLVAVGTSAATLSAIIAAKEKVKLDHVNLTTMDQNWLEYDVVYNLADADYGLFGLAALSLLLRRLPVSPRRCPATRPPSSSRHWLRCPRRCRS